MREIHDAQSYILLNCIEVEPFVSMYVQSLEEEFPGIAHDQINEKLDKEFSCWFKDYAKCNHIKNGFLCSLAHGPLLRLKCHSMCFDNGYKFHTENHSSARSIMNSGVCISDPSYGDYYGRIQEILQVEYGGVPLKHVVLFNCEWFDPNGGVKEHAKYKLVDVNHRSRYTSKYEPFILELQETQVCYVPYPSMKKK